MEEQVWELDLLLLHNTKATNATQSAQGPPACQEVSPWKQKLIC